MSFDDFKISALPGEKLLSDTGEGGFEILVQKVFERDWPCDGICKKRKFSSQSKISTQKGLKFSSKIQYIYVLVSHHMTNFR